MMKTQRSDTEKIIWSKKVKKKALMKLLEKMHKYKMMLSYCLKCRNYRKNIDPKISVTSNGKTMILLNCVTCSSTKSKFIRKQEADGLLSSFRIKTPLRKIPLVGAVLF